MYTADSLCVCVRRGGGREKEAHGKQEIHLGDNTHNIDKNIKTMPAKRVFDTKCNTVDFPFRCLRIKGNIFVYEYSSSRASELNI